MSSCKAIYCYNSTRKTPGKILCFQFLNPKTGRKRAEIWLKNITNQISNLSFFIKDNKPYFDKL